MYTKDSVWKYEKEYRIVTRNHKDIENDMFDSYKNQKGSLHKTQEFNKMLQDICLKNGFIWILERIRQSISMMVELNLKFHLKI